MAATLEADRTLLHESDEKFRALSDQSCVGIVTIVDGKITYANERMAQLSGYSVEEILRMHPVDAAVESERARVADYMQKFLAGETTEAKFAYHGLRKDGTVLDIETYNSVMHIGGKRGLIVVNLDVSDRVHAEQELQVLHTQMREQAIHDGLTGIFNRRYLDETLTRELIRAQRVSYPVSVIMGDIDYFKKINDKYGHQAGDDVLKEFARLLKRYCRGSDIPCRYGGEEFLLLMPDSPLDGAVRRAEELRLAMADMRLEYDGSPLGKITISLGVASFPEHGADAKSLLHAADEALYEAKGTGRDRVVVYRRFD